MQNQKEKGMTNPLLRPLVKPEIQKPVAEIMKLSKVPKPEYNPKCAFCGCYNGIHLKTCYYMNKF